MVLLNPNQRLQYTENTQKKLADDFRKYVKHLKKLKPSEDKLSSEEKKYHLKSIKNLENIHKNNKIWKILLKKYEIKLNKLKMSIKNK